MQNWSIVSSNYALLDYFNNFTSNTLEIVIWYSATQCIHNLAKSFNIFSFSNYSKIKMWYKVLNKIWNAGKCCEQNYLRGQQNLKIGNPLVLHSTNERNNRLNSELVNNSPNFFAILQVLWNVTVFIELKRTCLY